MRNKPVRMLAYVYVQCIHVLEIGVVVDNVAVYIVSLLNHHRSNIDALVSLRPTRFAISDVYAERVAQTRSASGRLAYARGWNRSQLSGRSLPLQILASPPPQTQPYSLCIVVNWFSAKNSNFGATRRQILRLKCTKFAGTPDPAGGARSTPPEPVAVFNNNNNKQVMAEGSKMGLCLNPSKCEVISHPDSNIVDQTMSSFTFVSVADATILGPRCSRAKFWMTLGWHAVKIWNGQ